MTNRRGAPHTAQASGAKGPLRKLGGNAESFRPRERDRRFFIIQKQLQRLLFREEDESECAEYRVQIILCDQAQICADSPSISI